MQPNAPPTRDPPRHPRCSSCSIQLLMSHRGQQQRTQPLVQRSWLGKPSCDFLLKTGCWWPVSSWTVRSSWYPYLRLSLSGLVSCPLGSKCFASEEKRGTPSGSWHQAHPWPLAVGSHSSCYFHRTFGRCGKPLSRIAHRFSSQWTLPKTIAPLKGF